MSSSCGDSVSLHRISKRSQIFVKIIPRRSNKCVKPLPSYAKDLTYLVEN